MGASQSIRATHFQRPSKETHLDQTNEDDFDDHHISISNKMVERLVEDATLAGGAAAAAVTPTPKPKGDYRDKIFMEKLKYMDDSHSERRGLTLEGLNAITNRIEMRTANMVSAEPVCDDCKKKVIDCYNDNITAADTFKCWDTVAKFSNCVSDTAAERLRARTQKDARDHARRTRHVAHAREHALRDLSPHFE